MNKSFWQIVGLRRSRSFFIVLAVNIALVAALVMWFMPQKEEQQVSLTKADQEKLRLQGQIVELPKRFEQMKQNEDAYDSLRLKGFFADQDRIAFRQILSDLRTSSGVRQVAYDIKPQAVIENQALSNTDKQLLSSEITVSLKGLTDLEMRSFVHALQDAVPGVSTISKQYFKRLDDLNDVNLVKLGNGEPIDFVESGYSFNWYTLYDKQDPYGMQTPGGDAGGARPVAPGVPVPAAAAGTSAPIPAVNNPVPAPAAAPTPAPVAPPTPAPAAPTGGK